jgi:hypothetical protein
MPAQRQLPPTGAKVRDCWPPPHTPVRAAAWDPWPGVAAGPGAAAEGRLASRPYVATAQRGVFVLKQARDMCHSWLGRKQYISPAHHSTISQAHIRCSRCLLSLSQSFIHSHRASVSASTMAGPAARRHMQRFVRTLLPLALQEFGSAKCMTKASKACQGDAIDLLAYALACEFESGLARN